MMAVKSRKYKLREFISEKDFFIRPVLFIAAVIFLLINISTLYQGHNWGGDFSQYMIHAQNLAEGQPYSDNIALDLWVVSPPGFPIILSPLVHVFGLNLKILKLINVFFWLFYALVLGKLAQRRLGSKVAVGIILAILSSPYFFWFKQNILSDIPFLFFITIGLWAALNYFEREHPQEQRRLWLCLCLCFMFWAQITRLAGATLFVAMIIYIFLSGKDKKTLIPIGGAWVLAFAVLGFFGISPWQHLKEIDLGFLEWLKISYLRCADLVKYAIAFYLPPSMKTSVSAPLFPFFEKACDILNPFILFAIAAVSWLKIRKTAVSLIGIFSGVYFFAWAGWSLSGGERYGLPIFGLVFILIMDFFVKSCRKKSILTERILLGLLAVLICHNCISIFNYYDFNDDYIYVKTTQEMTTWIKGNTPPDARFMFYKPRILSLLTRRAVATNWNFWQHPREDQEAWLKRVERLKIDYLIKAKLLNDYWFLSPRDIFNSANMRPVWQNEEYIILQILRK